MSNNGPLNELFLNASRVALARCENPNYPFSSITPAQSANPANPFNPVNPIDPIFPGHDPEYLDDSYVKKLFDILDKVDIPEAAIELASENPIATGVLVTGVTIAAVTYGYKKLCSGSSRTPDNKNRSPNADDISNKNTKPSSEPQSTQKSSRRGWNCTIL